MKRENTQIAFSSDLEITDEIGFVLSVTLFIIYMYIYICQSPILNFTRFKIYGELIERLPIEPVYLLVPNINGCDE